MENYPKIIPYTPFYQDHGFSEFQMSSTTLTPKRKTAEFANSVDPDEATHNQPPHLDLHCLSSSL